MTVQDWVETTVADAPEPDPHAARRVADLLFGSAT
jgi:hypothetical protein